ncbi:MAG: hypothetical protein AABY22_30755, partial [Nanoarchaeota archaeon]
NFMIVRNKEVTKMGDLKELCKSVKGTPEGENCKLPQNSELFEQCKDIGGEKSNGVCVIKLNKLKEL